MCGLFVALLNFYGARKLTFMSFIRVLLQHLLMRAMPGSNAIYNAVTIGYRMIAFAFKIPNICLKWRRLVLLKNNKQWIVCFYRFSDVFVCWNQLLVSIFVLILCKILAMLNKIPLL